jgi:hypothetical protein
MLRRGFKERQAKSRLLAPKNGLNFRPKKVTELLFDQEIAQINRVRCSPGAVTPADRSLE